MTKDNIRVLIVDDSAVMRALLSDQIASVPGMSVAGTARNGPEALAANVALRPDVITLDLQMPGMDGLAVLDGLLQREPVRVVMVSALTRAGAAVTLDALDRGAMDYVAKPENAADGRALFTAELIRKIRSASEMDIQRVLAWRRSRAAARSEAAIERPVKRANEDCPAELAGRCVALGISTGGPPALTRLLAAIRPPMPPIVIVQHMPPQFTGPLAARLDSLSPLTVREAVQGDVLKPNSVLVAPGGMHLELRRRGTVVAVALRDAPPVSGHKPSIDVMMTSAAKIFGPDCLGVIMTGMGRDGADGCRAIRAAGGYVLGQDQASSDVYGMNRAAYAEGNVDQQFGLQEAAAILFRQVRRLGTPAVAARRPAPTMNSSAVTTRHDI
jgi:two-component system, chemotaxis family, protein-glutamate methylesterase/glutaminase